MGYAKIIKGVSFVAKNLGQVTPVIASDLDRIEIVQGEVINHTIQFSINYTSVDGKPVKNEQKGVIWTIESGNEYADIDSNTGILNIKEAAIDAVIIVKAVSLFDNNIFSIKEIKVSYYNYITSLRALDVGVVTLEGVKLTSDSVIESSIKYLSDGTESSHFAIGAVDSATNNKYRISVYFGSKLNTVAFRFGDGAYSQHDYLKGDFVDFELDYNGVTFDGNIVNFSTKGVENITSSLQIFNLPGMLGGGRGEIKYIRIKEHGEYIHNICPYYESETNWGIHDKVTNRIFNLSNINNLSYVM